MDLLQQLLPLEEQLLALGDACNPACVEALLASDFFEFGASGRIWTREAIVQELAIVASRACQIVHPACRELGSNAALLTYQVTVAGRTTLRSSLWVRNGEAWQLTFHQGTDTAHVDVESEKQ